MVLKWHAYLAMMFIFAIVTSYAHGDTFECAFIQDKFEQGKPNMASCSMYPEKVYSTNLYTPKKYEHCKVENVYSFEDLTDVIVDIDDKSVIWTKHFGLTDEAKRKQKAYYIKNGMGESEANEIVNYERKDIETYKIISHIQSNTTIYFDEVKKTAYKPSKEVPEHTLMLKGKYRLLYLYIPEASENAIIIEPSGTEDASWIGIRFGRCRKIKK